MKCQSLFSEKERKNIMHLSSAELGQIVVKLYSKALLARTTNYPTTKAIYM